jgi:cyanate permease
VTYTPNVLRVLAFALPFIALAAVTVLLKRVDAGSEIVFAVFGLIAVLTGVAIGLFAGRPGGPRRQSRASIASRRAAPGAR